MADQQSGTGISRRRVLIGTAWATPVVVVGVGVPQAAASVISQPGDLLVIDYSALVSDTDGQLRITIAGRTQLPDGWPPSVMLTFSGTVTVTGPDGYDETFVLAPLTVSANGGDIHFQYVLDGLAAGDYNVTWDIAGEGAAVPDDGNTYAMSPNFTGSMGPETVGGTAPGPGSGQQTPADELPPFPSTPRAERAT